MARYSPVGRLTYRTDAATAKFSVKVAWKRLVKWSKKHLPGKGGAGDPPATSEQITAFEKAIGIQLPADVRQSFRLYNGQCPGPGIIYGLAGEPLQDCLHHWKSWSKYGPDAGLDSACTSFPAGYVQPVYFDPKWIPLTYDGSGNHIGIDLNPGPKGVPGQVIIFGRDDQAHSVVALSWGQFLTDIADELESGNVSWGEEEPEIPDIGVADPHSTHFHSVGFQWSRAKLGLRKLSVADQRSWRKACYR